MIIRIPDDRIRDFFQMHPDDEVTPENIKHCVFASENRFRRGILEDTFKQFLFSAATNKQAQTAGQGV